MSESDLQSDFATALQLQLAKKWNEAEGAYRNLAGRVPEEPVFPYNLGLVLKAQSKFQEAIDQFRLALRLNPHFPEATNNLATTLTVIGEIDEAIDLLQACTHENPRFARAFNNLGDAYKDRGEIELAAHALQRAVELDPVNPTFLSNLIYALHYHPQSTPSSLRTAAERWNRTFNLSPSNGSNLSPAASLPPRTTTNSVSFDLSPSTSLSPPIPAHPASFDLSPSIGCPSENGTSRPSPSGDFNLSPSANLPPSTAANRVRFDLSPPSRSPAVSVPFGLSPPSDPSAGFNLFPSDPLSPSDPSDLSPNDPSPAHLSPGHGDFDLSPIAEGRPILDLSPGVAGPPTRRRIGYIGAFFRRHCQSLFLTPLLAHHDRTQFEIFCYSDDSLADEVTLRVREYVDHWRDIAGQTTSEITERIRGDGLDVLVDLGLHTAQNYLPVFSRRPARRQISWLGYPGTTGLSTIESRLTDPYLDPIGQNDSAYTEKSLRLPHTFWCYDPIALTGKSIPLPARDYEPVITFGCLNNFCKVNDEVLVLWSQILAEVPHSRLVLMAPRGQARSRVRSRLNIEESRLTFVEFAPRETYLERYRSIDLCLDTYPYNGHTTSLDALWMGVPIVTLCGQTAVSRAGYSLLANLGLSALTAFSPDDFVRIAVELARDRSGLAELHQTLRARVEKSPLMDAVQFARDFENTLFSAP